jgi:NAD(P)H dehydrogenase (quinone)
MIVAVTGAAGALGAETARQLLAELSPDQVILISRRPEAVPGDLRATGAEVRPGDFDDPASLRAAFSGADRAFVVTTTHESTGRRVEQHRHAIEAAASAGVTHIALPTMPKVDADHPTGEYALEYPASEHVLKECGAGWTILQNGPYAENLVGRAAIAAATGELTSNAGEGQIAPVSHADCARAAAAVLSRGGHVNRTYVITGPELFTQAQLAELFAEVSGRPVTLVDFSDGDHPSRLARDGVPEPFPRLFTAHLKAVRLGYFNDQTDAVAQITGRAPERLRDVLDAHRSAIVEQSSVTES